MVVVTPCAPPFETMTTSLPNGCLRRLPTYEIRSVICQKQYYFGLIILLIIWCLFQLVGASASLPAYSGPMYQINIWFMLTWGIKPNAKYITHQMNLVSTIINIDWPRCQFIWALIWSWPSHQDRWKIKTRSPLGPRWSTIMAQKVVNWDECGSHMIYNICLLALDVILSWDRWVKEEIA
jgi:hypothetical protein